MGGEIPRQTSILGILVYDMKILKEDEMLHHLVEAEGLGPVDLSDYDVPDETKKTMDVGACWAIWSVPFDREEEFWFVATVYHLSPAVHSFWERELTGPILWFGTTLESIAEYTEKHAEEVANSGVGKAAAASLALAGAK